MQCEIAYRDAKACDGSVCIFQTWLRPAIVHGPLYCNGHSNSPASDRILDLNHRLKLLFYGKGDGFYIGDKVDGTKDFR